jgi:hypothetical protein
MARVSKRQRQIDAVVERLFRPAFSMYPIEQGPSTRYRVMENPLSSPSEVGAAYAPTDRFSQVFDDQKVALFCRNEMNAEAILKAIESVE